MQPCHQHTSQVTMCNPQLQAVLPVFSADIWFTYGCAADLLHGKQLRKLLNVYNRCVRGSTSLYRVPHRSMCPETVSLASCVAVDIQTGCPLAIA